MNATTHTKRTPKPLIGSRAVRAYLLEREEHLQCHPDSDRQLIEAVRTILDAAEGRATV